MKFFSYGQTEIAYLKSKDEALDSIIDQVGHIHREVDTDLFSAVAHHIIAQQISTKAQATIWARLKEKLGTVTPETAVAARPETLQAAGLSFRKVDYIKDFATKIVSGAFAVEAIEEMSDAEAIEALCALKGVGVWTAEMILLFCYQRPNILSFDDLAIQRGMRMVYHHRKINRPLFEKYRRRLSPYCSVASLYFWAVSGGALPTCTDPASKKREVK